MRIVTGGRVALLVVGLGGPALGAPPRRDGGVARKPSAPAPSAKPPPTRDRAAPPGPRADPQKAAILKHLELLRQLELLRDLDLFLRVKK